MHCEFMDLLDDFAKSTWLEYDESLTMNCYPTKGAGGLRERKEPLITQVASSLAFCVGGSSTFCCSSHCCSCLSC